VIVAKTCRASGERRKVPESEQFRGDTDRGDCVAPGRTVGWTRKSSWTVGAVAVGRNCPRETTA